MLEKGNLENRYSKLENHAKGLTSSNFISRGSGGLDGYGNNYNQIQRSNAILGCSFVTASYGALKQ
jgi:hypothetical protein